MELRVVVTLVDMATGLWGFGGTGAASRSPVLTRDLWVYSGLLGKDVAVITFMGVKG